MLKRSVFRSIRVGKEYGERNWAIENDLPGQAGPIIGRTGDTS